MTEPTRPSIKDTEAALPDADIDVERPLSTSNGDLVIRYPHNLYVQYIYAPLSRHIFLFIIGIFAFWYLSYKVCMMFSDAAAGERCERKAEHIFFGVEVLVFIQSCYVSYLKAR